MVTPQALLTRLDQIGQSLAQTGQALALLGLGSVGEETSRLDAYSDLDFFVIVRPPHKAAFIATLAWLSAPAPLVYAFQNTADGYKALYADDIFCEFAVFEPDELAHIPFAPGRIIWAAPDFDVRLGLPPARRAPPVPQPVDWLLGEALTNLYVGLGRYLRGETLSAMRFIQGYAVDRVVDLAAQVLPPQPALVDPFSAERRFEQRFPLVAAALPAMLPGYAHCPAAAQAILRFLGTHFAIDPAMHAAITARIAAGYAQAAAGQAPNP